MRLKHELTIDTISNHAPEIAIQNLGCFATHAVADKKITNKKNGHYAIVFSRRKDANNNTLAEYLG